MGALYTLALLLGMAPFGADASSLILSGALIQERGTPLRGGQMVGQSQVDLERAAGGDTPVLTFASDRGPVRLLLDTGAASAMVTPGVAKRLGLQPLALSPQMFSLAGGGGDCGTFLLAKTTLPELRLPSGTSRPPLRLRGLEALVLPVAALPDGVDGVLGAPSLKQLPFVVDPLGGHVRIGAPALLWRPATRAQPEVIPLAWRRGVPLLSLWIQPREGRAKREIAALADTGAEGLFLTAKAAATLTPLGPPQAARLVGVCGEQDVQRQRLMGVGVAQGTPLQSVEAILTRNPVFSLLGVEAIAGQEVLRGRQQRWRLDLTPPRLELW